MINEFFSNGGEMPNTAHLEVVDTTTLVALLHPQVSFVFIKPDESLSETITKDSISIANRLRDYYGDTQVAIVSQLSYATAGDIRVTLRMQIGDSMELAGGPNCLTLIDLADAYETLRFALAGDVPRICVAQIPVSDRAAVKLFETLEAHKDLSELNFGSPA